jgi:probable phosphoglycerate mutase
MLYVVKHGDTDWNMYGKVMGRKDLPLNAAGQTFAAMVSGNLCHLKFDICFSSPLQRAIHTAQAIFNGDIRVDHRIIERDAGVFEGTPSTFNLSKFWRRVSEAFENAETLKQMEERIFSFVNDLRRNFHNRDVLVVTHESVCKIIKSYFHGFPPNDDYKFFHLREAFAEYPLNPIVPIPYEPFDY